MTAEEIRLYSLKEKHSSFAYDYAALQDGINERNLADRSKWHGDSDTVDAWMHQSRGLFRWAGFYANGHLHVGSGFVFKI